MKINVGISGKKQRYLTMTASSKMGKSIDKEDGGGGVMQLLSCAWLSGLNARLLYV